jgi:hypothetical protein
MRRVGRGCGVSSSEYSCAYGAQIIFGYLTPYLTYGSRAQYSLRILVQFEIAWLVFLTWSAGIIGMVYFPAIFDFPLFLALGLNFNTPDKNCHGGEMVSYFRVI